MLRYVDIIKLNNDKKIYIFKVNYMYYLLTIKINCGVFYKFLFFILMILSSYDILYFEVEDKAFLKLIVFISVYSLIQKDLICLFNLYNGIFMFILLYFIYHKFNDKIGGADIKLISIINFLFGYKIFILTIFFASLFSLVYYMFNVITLKYNERYIKFLPFINLGLIFSLLYERMWINVKYEWFNNKFWWAYK